MQPQDVNFHGQEQVYGDLGEEMLEHAFEGKSNEQKQDWKSFQCMTASISFDSMNACKL